MSHANTLTPEQKQVANADISQQTLVTAGPGTGKTHTLLARLGYLSEQGVAMSSEVLVLSFSRAAVRVIRERVRGGSEDNADIAFVSAATFDSFATQLLARFDPDGVWTTEIYDGRIKAAIALLEGAEGAEAREMVAGYAHILIDELQDLVGVRDRLVRAILGAAQGGWTLFGDPAQAIYNFSLEGSERTQGSGALYDWLRSQFADTMQTVELSHNHRATSPGAKQLAEKLSPLGAQLRALSPDYNAARDDLETQIADLKSLGELKMETTQAALRAPIASAILCRTNGQALMLSRYLREKGVAHHLRRGATERALPSWIAHIVSDWDGETMARASFEELCAQRLPNADAGELFRALRRFCPGQGRATVDVAGLGRRIREGNLPDELCEQGDHALTISTIHRAKGLEFDRVLMVWSRDDWRLETDDENSEFALPEECRTLFVAMTRPRKFLLRLPMLEHKGRLRKHRGSNRWTRKYQKWKVGDIEVRGDDSHALEPAGAHIEIYDARAAQERLLRAKIGETVNLRLKRSNDAEGAPRVFYVIEQDGQTLGVTNEAFGRDLHGVLKINRGWEINWPQSIEGLILEGVDSVAGQPATSVKHGLGSHGIWLRARVSGLGRLVMGRNP